MKNVLELVCPTQYLRHTIKKIPCLSEIQFYLGVLYFTYQTLV